MKRLIKKTVKWLIPKSVFYANRYMRTDLSFVRSRQSGRLYVVKDIIRYWQSHKFILPNLNKEPNIDAALQFKSYATKLNFNNVVTAPYFYPLDTSVVRVIPERRQPLASLTQDYAKILTFNLMQVKDSLKNNGDPFSRSIMLTIEAIEIVVKRAVKYYASQDQRLKGYLERMVDQSPKSFDEALQKILFFNALIWSNKQQHIGLGRLDMVLQPYLEKDLQQGILSIAQAKEKVKDFVKIIGAHTAYKSVGLVGDTGQVILLSGTDRHRVYVEHELTHLFLEVIDELNVPDPKLILRVCDQTTTNLWQKAIHCIARGNGSPLLANETKIMALMEQFGYQRDDVVEFGTSACWEPLIIGKSFDQNNCTENVNLPLVLSLLIDEDRVFDSYEEFETILIGRLIDQCKRIADRAAHIDFDRAPLQSLWMDGCLANLQDIGCGGAKYNYHGFLCVGLPNLVNSLLNIKKFVFQDKRMSVKELSTMLANNFSGNETYKELFVEAPKKFGKPDSEVIELSNKMMDVISKAFESTTLLGHKVKVGFSSPGYLMYGQCTPAGSDGRSAREPFATHISPVSKDVDFAEIVDFAAQLDYSGNKINGNVVDFILSEQFAKNDDKFSHILKIAFRRGVYEMQLNVLNAEKLIAAKADPSLYPYMVVRVWGFSAYFNDLPESYKNHLINRALNYKVC